MIRILPLLVLLLSACGAPAENPLVTSTDGVEIGYSATGEGEPALVFVHGWTLDRSHWDAQMDHFAPMRRAVAVDLAGHGESGTARNAWTMEAFGRDVVAVVEALNLDRVVLVGHSMGGSVVLEAARLLDDRVAGIVLVDAFHDPDERMADADREGLLALYREDFKTNVSSTVRQYLFAPETDSVLADRIATQMASFDPAIGVAAIDELYRSDYRELLGGLDVPMVAINAAIYPTNDSSMARYGIDVQTMEGVGHFPMVEAPERFNEILADAALGWE